jgi:hypothetical protein
MNEGASGRTVEDIFTTFINGHAAVAFELPDESFVSLKVYSILGKEIAELAGRNFSAGKHTVTLGNRNLAQGMYLYSFKTDKRSVSRKMIFSGYRH